MDDFIKKLEDDRMISVHTATHSVGVSKGVLSNLTHWLAEEVEQACENAADTDEQPDISCFCEFTGFTVNALLYWTYKHELPPEYMDAHSDGRHMDLWTLADLCELPALQDAVMLELLRNDANIKHDKDDLIHVLEQAQQMRDTPQLRRFSAEALMRRAEARDQSILEIAERIYDLGGKAELWRAYHRYTKYGQEIFDRFGEGEVSKEWWRKFMIGKWDGSEAHWVYEKAKEGRERKRKRGE